MATKCTCGVTQLNEKEVIMDMKEVAEYIGVHYDTLIDMVSKRKIPYVVINKRKKFYLRHINGWLEKKIIKAVA